MKTAERRTKMNYIEYEAQQTPIQIALREWVLPTEPNTFITLTFCDEFGVSYDQAAKAFGAFAHSIKCHFHGKNSKKRLFMFPVVEKSGVEVSGSRTKRQDGTHIHCLMQLANDPIEHIEITRLSWMMAADICGDPNIYCPEKEGWYLPMTDYGTRRKLTNYAIKSCALNTDTVLWKFVPKNRDLRARLTSDERTPSQHPTRSRRS